MTAVTPEVTTAGPVLVDGKPIRLRFVQIRIWGLVLAACGAAWVAGAYFNVLQVNWHIFYLKHWFDSGMGIFHSANFHLYRHGERDNLEPAIATLAVLTVLAKQKYWNKRAGPVYLVIAPVLVLLIAGIMAAGGVWLTDFGGPNAWHHLFGHHHWLAPQIVQHIWAVGQTIVIGVVIGLVVHRIWAPAGATIQGYYVDKSVDRHRASGTVPLWVTLPIAPVQLRERWSVMAADTANEPVVAAPTAAVRKGWEFLINTLRVLIVLLTAYLVVTGFLAHYYIGAGHHFPFLAP